MFAKKARTEAAAAAASDDSEERDVKIPVEADDEVAKAQAASDETAAEAASAEPADRDDTPEQAAASQAMTEEEMVEAAIRAGEEAAANDFKLKYEQAQNELAEVRKKLAAAEETATTADAKVREAQDRVARLQADWDNYRRRTASERLAEKSRATEKLVTALLPVLDDMERAIDHARTQEMDEAFSQFVDGVDMRALRRSTPRARRSTRSSTRPWAAWRIRSSTTRRSTTCTRKVTAWPTACSGRRW